MKYTIETEQEDDGRWIAEIPEIPGIMKYGETREKAIAKAKALLLRVSRIAKKTGLTPEDL